ncbi:hypothetical protein QBC43DRAFT_378951 [Cladorrhinum sp. PSN259]|nr:hypothetical protein QBC43DRAFT_378951 [Cladorrhinum sp. PSN259]
MPGVAMAEFEPTAPSRRIHRQRKTCMQCAKSKRKCDQTAPWCKRCIEKGIVCTYPTKRTIFAPYTLESYPLTAEPSSPPPDAPGSRTFSLPSHTPITDSSASSSGPRETPESGSSPGSDNASSVSLEDGDISPYQWFLSPDSWLRQCSSNQEMTNIDFDTPVSRETLPHFISTLKTWTRSYTSEGHSPLFHRQLYRCFMPDIIRDAYTSRTAYDLASTSEAKTMALRIIEDRTNNLVQSQPDNFNASETEPTGELIDTCTHLARTQALFIYQLTRLFDGDIRARNQAEAHIDTLHTWARQMIESARIDCMLGQSSQLTASQLYSPESRNGTVGLDTDMTSLCEISVQLATVPPSTTGVGVNKCVPARPPSLNFDAFESPFGFPVQNNFFTTQNDINIPIPILPSKPHVSVWHIWVVSESVRRIYLASEFMLAVYQTMKDSWSICPGGLMFCARQGLWDAPSGVEWCRVLKESAKKNKEWVLMQSLQSWKLLKQARPDEVDGFARGVMDISLGIERVERWLEG